MSETRVASPGRRCERDPAFGSTGWFEDSPAGSHFVSRAWLLPVLILSLLSACRCGPETEPDGGTEQPGADAGPHTGGGGGGKNDDDAGLPDGGLPPELKVFKILPPRGGSAGGARVLITGSGFVRGFATRGSEAARVTSLKFGQNPSLDFQIIDDETMDARVPPGRTGLTNVTVTNGNGTFVCTGCFTYYDELSLIGMTPREGPLRGGNEVTLTGAGFTSDVEVLFGGRSSPKVALVSSKELKVTAPGAAAIGLVDVVVYNKNGVGSQRRGYQYVDDLRFTTLAPLTGPLAGGTSVVLTGKGLSGATAVTFGGRPATSFTVNSATQLTAITPAGAVLGAVDVAVTTPCDTWKVRSGFTYVNTAGGFALYGVYPHLGPASGNNAVTLTGQGLNSGGLTVSFGGQPAVVGATTFSTAVVTVPPRGAAARKVNVAATASAGTGTVPDAYTYRLTVTGIAPSSGPSAGGTAATLTGTGFPADAQVWVGALTGATTPSSETSLSVITPSGSGGAASDVRVREAADPENEAVLPAAFTYVEPLSIGRVQPGRGAIAGNTLVTVLGAGFGESTVVTFGLEKAKDVKILDDHTLTCRTPRGEVGAVDVAVDRLGAHDDLPGGFSYYDPRSISGGLSGGTLTGTLNVTVLDGTDGFYGLPVPLANVMLGNDPGTPFQSRTDARGQVTFSDPSLVKAQSVTAYKEGFESATVTAVSAENLTVFVTRTGGSGEPGPPGEGVPPSLISGRVTGFKQPRPLVANEALEARVFTSQTSLFGGPPYRGPPNKQGEKWQITAEGGEYLVATRAGLRATYAVLGIRNNQTGTFEPYLMGIRRGITTSPENPAQNQDIVLDMHLDLTVPVNIDGPLSFPGGLADGGVSAAFNTVYAWLDLGTEGFIPNPNNWGTGTAAQSSVTGQSSGLSFPNFPRLDGANFVFLNEASGFGSYPVSYYFRRQPGDLSTGVTIGPMLPAAIITQPTLDGGFHGTIAWESEPGPAAQIHQVLVMKLTLVGAVTLWTVVLPGGETQVVLPPPAVQKLKDEEAGSDLMIGIISSRSPKFDYQQWTYDSLSTASWSSYTFNATDTFKP